MHPKKLRLARRAVVLGFAAVVAVAGTTYAADPAPAAATPAQDPAARALPARQPHG